VPTAVVITPSAATVNIGAAQSFAAAGSFSDGSTGPVSVTWTATGGMITTFGVYTAGPAAGTFRVIARLTSGTLADTAQVTIPPAPPALTAVVITPASATVTIGASQSFTAAGSFSDGSTGPVAVTWSATGGTITTAGGYTAGAAAGAFRVIARVTSGTLADTAQITIPAVPPVLTAVVITPPSATVNIGATQAFTAAGTFSDGSTGPVAVTWTATGGSISQTGLYAAGSTAGNYQVIAAAVAAVRADTSLVTIPPPTGGTVVLSENFEDNNAGTRGWYANTSPSISTAEHHSGAGSLQMTWQAGAILPDNGVSLRHLFTATDRVYIRYWVKYSANFVGSGKAYHPHEIQILTDVDDMWIGPSATHLSAAIETNWQNGGIPRLATTDVLNIDQTKIGIDLTNITEQRAVSGCNGQSDGYSTGCYPVGAESWNEKVWLAPQPVFTNTPGPGYKNDWHKVEVYFQLNTIVSGKGQNDGVAQYRFDGQLKIDLHNVLLRTGANPTMRFNQLLLAYYIGDGSPVAQTLWVDDLVVATGPVP
jgi:hypothetical protein